MNGQRPAKIDQAGGQHQAREAQIPPAIKREAGYHQQQVLQPPRGRQPIERKHQRQKQQKRERRKRHAAAWPSVDPQTRGSKPGREFARRSAVMKGLSASAADACIASSPPPRRHGSRCQVLPRGVVKNPQIFNKMSCRGMPTSPIWRSRQAVAAVLLRGVAVGRACR
jgi:hypothetical protein